MKDAAESLRLARYGHGPGRCFDNARLALLVADPPRGTRYVEGWAVLPDLPVQLNGQPAVLVVYHAWLQAPDGRIFDPTWPEAERVAHYFPAASYLARDPRLRGPAPILEEHQAYRLPDAWSQYEAALELSLRLGQN